MISITRPLSVALAATLLFAACGSDGDAGTDDATTTEAVEATVATETSTPTTTDDTTATTDTTEVPEQDVEADAAAAADARLTLADLPDGWTEADGPNEARTEIEALVAECVGADSLTSADASAGTADFTSPEGTLVVAERVGVQATERDARTVLALLTTPEVPGCVAEAYASLGTAALSGTVAEGAEIGEVTADRLAVGAAGNATQAIRVNIPVTAGGATTQYTVDLVVVRSERSLAVLTFENSVEPTPVETIDSITAVAAALLPA
jgi:hypothetical protein